MADSSMIGIPHGLDSELRELPRTPLTPSPIRSPPLPPCPTTTQSPTSTTPIDKTLSSAANLLKLLPSGTVLAFQSLSPSFTNKGSCYPSNKYLTSALILLCSLSCIFFSFTDSLIGRDGKLYYGIATVKGFRLFNYEGSEEERSKVFKDMGRFRIRRLDYVHALLSVVLFLTITFSDSDIQSCLFPRAGANSKELLVNLPLGAAFLSSLLFVIFPTSRKGIGYADGSPQAQ